MNMERNGQPPAGSYRDESINGARGADGRAVEWARLGDEFGGLQPSTIREVDGDEYYEYRTADGRLYNPNGPALISKADGTESWYGEDGNLLEKRRTDGTVIYFDTDGNPHGAPAIISSAGDQHFIEHGVVTKIVRATGETVTIRDYAA